MVIKVYDTVSETMITDTVYINCFDKNDSVSIHKALEESTVFTNEGQFRFAMDNSNPILHEIVSEKYLGVAYVEEQE